MMLIFVTGVSVRIIIYFTDQDILRWCISMDNYRIYKLSIIACDNTRNPLICNCCGEYISASFFYNRRGRGRFHCHRCNGAYILLFPPHWISIRQGYVYG